MTKSLSPLRLLTFWKRVFPLVLWLTCLHLSAQVDADRVTIMGRNALSVDDYLTAIRYFNQAIEAKPFLSRPYFYRAYAKFTLEDYAGAEKDCTKSLELNPFITEVYDLRGLCRAHLGNYEGAVEDYTRTLAEYPDDQASRYNRSLCLLQLKDYARADSDLYYILDHHPKYNRAYIVKAQCSLEQGDTIGSIDWIDRLLAFAPNDGNALSFKGRYALMCDSFALADSCLTLAIQQMPDDYDLYVARAQARHALDQFGPAIADYDRAIELVPEHYVAHYNRGLLRSFVGDLNRAIEDFDFIIRIEPDNVLAIYNRARLRAEVGNYKGAIEDYSKLIDEYPNFTYGYLARAECRRKIGDTRGALADETVVAKRNLDLTYAKNTPVQTKKVRLHSEHELEQYSQLVQEDPDTVRNIFGTLYGKVQNEKTSQELMPMYVLAYRPHFVRGYHSIGFMPEVSQYSFLDTSTRKLSLTAEADETSAMDAEFDARRLNAVEDSLPALDRFLLHAAIDAMKYDYTTALNAAGQAVMVDSTSVLALMQRAFILMRSVATGTLEPSEAVARINLAKADLQRAARLSPENAYVAYNLGCLYAKHATIEEAINAFTRAIELDKHLPEAYYNRALLYLRLGEKSSASNDFSLAGQFGLYKAYAQLKKLK